MTLFHQRIFDYNIFKNKFDQVLGLYLDLLEVTDLGSDHYNSKRPLKISFRFHLSKDSSVKTLNLENAVKEVKAKIIADKVDNKVKIESQIIDKFRLPITTKIEDFGTIINQKGNVYSVLKSGTSNLIYKITTKDNSNKVILYNK